MLVAPACGGHAPHPALVRDVAPSPGPIPPAHVEGDVLTPPPPPPAPQPSATADAVARVPSEPGYAFPVFTGEVPGPPFSVAQALGRSVPVFDAPGATTPRITLSNPNEDGAPRVLLVVGQQGDWLQALLPLRPNGSVGWIRAADVNVVKTDYRIRIGLTAHTITVTKGSDVVLQEPVGVGRGNTPTPGGNYYITELLQPTAGGGAYGPYAYGLSGYSNVLRSFAGGRGVIGLHGTNDPAGLGHDVSHGCIRMSNAGITRLAAMLPLGTPVTILA